MVISTMYLRLKEADLENVEVLGGGVSTFVKFFNRTGKEVISQ